MHGQVESSTLALTFFAADQAERDEWYARIQAQAAPPYLARARCSGGRSRTAVLQLSAVIACFRLPASAGEHVPTRTFRARNTNSKEIALRSRSKLAA